MSISSTNVKNIKIFEDQRGTMKFINENITCMIKQQFLSINEKNVIRGIHCSPYGKIVTCLTGKFIDYSICLTDNPPTYKKYLLEKNSQVYIPPNHGHLFISLENNSQMLYQLEDIYNAEFDKNINYMDPYINLDIPNNNYILSVKDKNSSFLKPIDFIVLGGNGFIGTDICKTLEKLGKNFIKLNTRLENFEYLEKQLKLYKPKYVISAAGISGKPSVQWCENHKEETLHTNLTLQLSLMNLCKRLNIHLTICGSGLIYNGDKKFTEEDIPNLDILYYSKVRIMLEECLNEYDNVFYPRIIYPISSSGHDKCFLNKLVKLYHNSVNDIEISVTVLDSLLPHMVNLIENNFVGKLNFVNPNKIKLSTMLELYKKHINNTFKWTISNRPNPINCILDTTKIEKMCPTIDNVETAIIQTVLKINNN